MITKKDIIAAVRHIKEETRTRSRRLTNPVRDWFILLTVAIIAGSVCVIWSVFTFQKLQRDDYVPVVATDRVPTYNRDQTMEILEAHMFREAIRAGLVPIGGTETVDAVGGEGEVNEDPATEGDEVIISN